jgi:hypothetical protein
MKPTKVCMSKGTVPVLVRVGHRMSPPSTRLVKARVGRAVVLAVLVKARAARGLVAELAVSLDWLHQAAILRRKSLSGSPCRELCRA